MGVIVIYKQVDMCLAKMKKHSELRHGLLLEMCSLFKTFRDAVMKTEKPDTEWVLGYWKTKMEILKPYQEVGSQESQKLIDEFGYDVYYAVKDNYGIAKYYSGKLERYLYNAEVNVEKGKRE